MCGVARASSGTARRTSSDRPTSAWVVPAPIHTVSSLVRMPRNSVTLRRSTRWSKTASRNASIGIRL